MPAAACAGWTVLAGKDVNWDLLNYHYYVPYQLLAGRIEQDFFAASAQSYLNPIGFLPFYLMVSAGWHSVIVSVVLAVIHGLSLSLLFLLAWKLFAHLPGRERMVFAALDALSLAVAAMTGMVADMQPNIENLKKAADAGLTIVMGTDAGPFPERFFEPGDIQFSHQRLNEFRMPLLGLLQRFIHGCGRERLQ